MLKKLLIVGVVIASIAAALNATAQGRQRTPEEQAIGAVATRQAVMRLLSFNTGPINGMARGQVEFDAALAERNALRVAFLAPMIAETFAAMDTRPYAVETGALPVIWDDTEEFAQKVDALVQGANEFAEIAARGDQNEIMGAVSAFGSNCGSCHDSYRD